MAIPWRAVVLAITINLLWGANVPAVKIALIAIPPLWTAFWRFSLGTCCLVAWAYVSGVSLRPRREEWRGLLLLGLIFTVQIALMNLGIRFTTAAMASVLIATNPLFAGLYAHLFVPGGRLTKYRAAGLTVAFLGIGLILVRDPAMLVGGSTTLGNLICLASASLLGGRLVFSARLLQRIDSTRVVVWQMVLSLPCFAVAAWLTESVAWDRLGWYPLSAIAYQGIVVAGFNFMGMAYLLKRYNPSVVVGFNFLSPLFGVLISMLLLSEAITLQFLAGMVGVGLGLFLVTRR